MISEPKHPISERLAKLAVSETLAMAQKSRELKRQGVDIIDLSIGEPDFDTPNHIKEAAIQAIHDNFTHYPPVPGFLDLREAICEKFRRDNGLEYSAEQVVVSNGAKQSIANILLSLLNPGDEVVIPAPYWVSYPEMVKMAEGVPVFIPAGIESNFKIGPEQLRQAITDKTKVFLFSSPSNPTGEIYTCDELQALAGVFREHPEVMVISDEIYEYINYSSGHCSLAQLPGMQERVAVVNGVSKGFAMTGWRIGYMAGPAWLAKACVKLQGQYTSGASTIAQKAALTAVSGGLDDVRKMVEIFRERRDLVVKLLDQIPYVQTNTPPGAFYVLPVVSAYYGKSCNGQIIKDSQDLAMYLLNEGHVAVVTGSAFGAPECLRLSYSTSTDKLQTAIQRIQQALSRLT